MSALDEPSLSSVLINYVSVDAWLSPTPMDLFRVTLVREKLWESRVEVLGIPSSSFNVRGQTWAYNQQTDEPNWTFHGLTLSLVKSFVSSLLCWTHSWQFFTAAQSHFSPSLSLSFVLFLIVSCFFSSTPCVCENWFSLVDESAVKKMVEEMGVGWVEWGFLILIHSRTKLD